MNKEVRKIILSLFTITERIYNRSKYKQLEFNSKNYHVEENKRIDSNNNWWKKIFVLDMVWYGKSDIRPLRKLGHINIID